MGKKKTSKPQNSRCPKCRAKLKRRGFTIICNRCGYSKYEPEDNLTIRLIYGGF